MNVLITFDYELFFGEEVGTVENCLIRPTEKLIEIAEQNNVVFNFFIDSCYLMRLLKLKSKFPELEEDYSKVMDQLKVMANKGHSLELHIHPHWYKSEYKGEGKWFFDYSYYKLTDFDDYEIDNIITENVVFIKENLGITPHAYRAGGWSIEPFKKISDSLRKNNISIDSTVVPEAVYNSEYQEYNFSNCPKRTIWRFNNNPVLEEKNGDFIEIPISSFKNGLIKKIKVVILNKLLNQKETTFFGDGKTITKSKIKTNLILKIKNLLKSEIAYVSLDGISSIYLNSVYKKYLKNFGKDSYFVVLGHPKSLSNFSIKQMEDFILKNSKARFLKYSDVRFNEG